MNVQHMLDNLVPSAAGHDARALALTGVAFACGGVLLGAALTAFVTPVSGPALRRRLARLVAPPPRHAALRPSARDAREHPLAPLATQTGDGQLVATLDDLAFDAVVIDVADAPGHANYDRRHYAR